MKDKPFVDFANLKQDDRPKKGGWSPGKYIQKCNCGDSFIGDKRAIECADCAYSVK